MASEMGRSKAIDILRALAVILVLGRHMSPVPEGVSRLLHSASVIWYRGGWVGVDLFFVLSGFLVSGLLFREHRKFGKISGSQFLLRRGFKIYPAFWLLLFITVVVGFLVNHPRDPSRVATEFLFLQNYRLGLWAHTWSLAVEEHFYFSLVALVLILSLHRESPNPFGAIPKIFVMVAFLCLAFRTYNWNTRLFDVQTHLYPSHLRIDSLLAGVLISYYYHYYPEQYMSVVHRYRALLLVASVLLLCPAFIFPLETTPFISTAGLSLFYMGSGCLMSGLLAVRIQNRGVPSWLAYVGSHSYSIYLWHVPWLVWAIPVLSATLSSSWNWYLYFLTYFFGSVILGIVLAKMIEFPMLQIRDRWFPSRGQPLTTERISNGAVG